MNEPKASEPIPKNSALNFVGTDKCPKCEKQVYFAEQVVACGAKFHKQCFVCTDCGKGLDSRNLADNAGVVYCKGCHGKVFIRI
jgi:cysteine/glycine-rich protein